MGERGERECMGVRGGEGGVVRDINQQKDTLLFSLARLLNPEKKSKFPYK